MDATRLAAPSHHFRFSGMAPKSDVAHAMQDDPNQVIAPIKVPVPGGHYVAQYAPTVVGGADVYDPAGDCNGNFMSAKFQANNNCYNYATDVATNSFAQPGRKHGILLNDLSGPKVEEGAEKDGLITIAHHPMSSAELEEAKKDLPAGHFVALLMSAPDPTIQWPGDYHWVRRDTDGTWSQKDGPDQVTNFDFAGHPIDEPAGANWKVNQGPISASNSNDAVVGYKFYSIMYAPDNQLDII